MEDQLANWKPATAANRYSGIRPFFTWLVDEGEVRESPMARMRKSKLPEFAPPILADDELRRILAGMAHLAVGLMDCAGDNASCCPICQ